MKAPSPYPSDKDLVLLAARKLAVSLWTRPGRDGATAPGDRRGTLG